MDELSNAAIYEETKRSSDIMKASAAQNQATNKNNEKNEASSSFMGSMDFGPSDTI